MKRWVILMALLGVSVSGGMLMAQNKQSSTDLYDRLRVRDDVEVQYGTDADYQWVFNSAGGELQLKDAADNLLGEWIDAGTAGDLGVTGDVDVTGDVGAATFTGDGSGLTSLPSQLPVDDGTAVTKGSVDPTKLFRIENDTNVPTATEVVASAPSVNVSFEPGVTYQAVDADLTTIAGFAKTKGHLIVGDGTVWMVFPVGSDGEALTAASGETSGLEWAAIGDTLDALAKTKGNIAVADGSVWSVVPAGTNDQVLTVDSAQTLGVRWATNAPSDGASQTLDNLDTGLVAINTDLEVDTDATHDLGAPTARWDNVYTVRLRAGDTASNTLLLEAFDVDGATWVTFATLTSANTPTMDLAASVTQAGFPISNTGTAGVYTAQQNFGTATLTDAASITWNLATQQVATVTLAGNRTLENPTNRVNGGTYIVIVKQDATGSRTLAYGTAYKWPGGTAPTLSTGANAVDIITFISDGTNMYAVAVQDFS